MPRGSGEHFNPTYLLFSGISCGLAATTHGSTTFFAPIVVLIIFLEYWLKSQQTYFKRFKRFFASAAIFSVGFFISYAIFGALVGYSYAFQAIMSESTIRGSEDLNRLTLLSKYLFEGPKRSVSLIALYAFWIAVLFHIGQFLKDREWKLVKHSSLILFIGFCLLFSIVFQSVFYPRIFLPLNILILITILSAIQQVFRYLPIWKSRIFAAICMLFIAYLTFQSGYEDILSHYRGSVVGGPRAAQNVLKGRVSRDNRLLVAPYIQRVHRPQFKHQLYFGENVSYLVECKNGSLGEFIRNNKIKFVFISEGLDATIPASTQERYSQIGICTGMNKSNYKVTKDIKRIHKFLKKNGALLLESIPKYGEVYELNN